MLGSVTVSLMTLTNINFLVGALYIHSCSVSFWLLLTCTIAPSVTSLKPLSSATLVTLNIGFNESVYLIDSFVIGSILSTAYQLLVCKYALAVGNILSHPAYSELTLVLANILFSTLTIIRLADCMSLNIVCLGLKLIPYFSTSLNVGSGTGEASAFSPHKLSISLSLKCSGTMLLESPSLINFHAV